MAVLDATSASLACFAASALAIETSRSALAFAIAASLEICEILSIPKFSITWLLSEKFWILKLTSSRPNLDISGITFSLTASATPFLSWTSCLIPTVPIISRILPSRTCLTCSIKSSWPIPKVASNALSSNSGSLETFKLATPSTLILINSFVGMDSRVLMSTWKTFKDNLSFLCKNGSLQPAFPLKIFLLPAPEIIIASSGPAFV